MHGSLQSLVIVVIFPLDAWGGGRCGDGVVRDVGSECRVVERWKAVGQIRRMSGHSLELLRRVCLARK
jgi:hypothetical protein